MLLVLEQLLHILFPPSDDERLLQSINPDSFVKKYSYRNVDETTALSSFKDAEIRSAIHINKFHGNKDAAQLLAALLTKWLSEQEDKEFLLIPIPLSRKSLRKRGFNQVTQIAEITKGNTTKISIAQNILYKIRETPPQSSLTREERLKNINGVFAIHKHNASKIKGKDIILLDDVMTTGTTLREAKATLLPHSPTSVTCIAIAH